MQEGRVNIYKTAQCFGCVIADPPWASESGGRNGKGGWSKTCGANAHYPLMNLPQICELPVSQIVRDDAHLWLWVTNGILARGDHVPVIEAWGFRPVTVTTWRKTTGYGLGQYLRGYTEHVVLCVRGRPPYAREPSTGKRVQGRTYFEAPRGVHSQKPDQIHRWAELISPGPRIELFARRTVPGWAVWGNEV